jgi:peptidyl-dipeptidase A
MRRARSPAPRPGRGQNALGPPRSGGYDPGPPTASALETRTMDPEVRREIKKFLHEHVEKLKPLHKKHALAVWKLNTTGTEEAQQRSADLAEKIKHVYADRPDFRLVGEWLREFDDMDAVLERQLEVLQLRFLEHQTDLVTIRESVQLEAELEARFANHRGMVDGQAVGDNEIREILAVSNDTAARREAWEASKSIGPVVRRGVLRLVHLRNQSARRLGFRDHYEMALKLQEIDEELLLTLLDDLESETNEPFRRAKEELDARLAERFGVSAWDLRPWHYADPFFQEAPPDPALDLDRLLAGSDPTVLAERTFRRCGLSIEDVIKASDLEERTGKCQHAFCLTVDREAKDVRVLSNVVPGERWTSTLLHEFGHAAYDKYQDVEMPWLLMAPAHESTTEAVAMLFGRLTRDEEWLRKIARVDGDAVEEIAERLVAQRRMAMLIFVRWAIVLIRFERQLYRDPEQDLDRLWWDLVRRVQRVNPPEGRRLADWAAKIHLSTAPVYYQNYLLGELTASQLQHHIVNRLPGPSRVVKPETGDFLVNGIFRAGRTRRWQDLLADATGEQLTPAHFVAQYLKS